MIVTAAAGTCFGTRSNASHQDLIPEPHTRTSKRISQDHQRRTFKRSVQDHPDKNFPWASEKNFHTSTNSEHLQDLHARTSRRGLRPDLHRIFSQGPVQDHARTSDRISLRSSQHLLTGPLQDLGQDLHLRTSKTAPWNSCQIVTEGPSRELIRFFFFTWISERQLKSAPRHNESDLTHTEWREGFVCDVHSRAAPQRERSDTHKVKRRLLQRYQNLHHTTTRAIRCTQSDEKVARAISKFAPRHNESDLTRTKWREDCASDIKIHNAPRWERSDTPKVTK